MAAAYYCVPTDIVIRLNNDDRSSAVNRFDRGGKSSRSRPDDHDIRLQVPALSIIR